MEFYRNVNTFSSYFCILERESFENRIKCSCFCCWLKRLSFAELRVAVASVVGLNERVCVPSAPFGVGLSVGVLRDCNHF